MLTLYYVSATFLHSWRINKICQKITEQLAQHASITFYALPNSTNDGFDAFLATSELCSNRSLAKVSQILWLHNNHRGCCLQPLQSIPVTPWITFSETSGLQPFAFDETPEQVLTSLETKQQTKLRLLIETEIEPCFKSEMNNDIVRIENYGKLLAWKIDSHLAVLVETNVEYFTKLLIHTFLQNNFLINDQLTLLRIESVRDEGTPQPYSMLSSHLRKPTRTISKMQPMEWPKHLEDLKSLSVLANQATEYAYNKHRTEAKTGIIKPDLIPQEKRVAKENKPRESPNKISKVEGNEKLEKKSEELRNYLKQDIPLEEHERKSQLIKETKGLIKAEEVKTGDTSITERKPTGAIPKVSIEAENLILPEAEDLKNQIMNLEGSIIDAKATPTNQSADSSTTIVIKSPSNIRAKPTEIKKPGTADEQRLKLNKASTDPSKKSSELEKIAAAKVAERSKSKSPVGKDAEKSATGTQVAAKAKTNERAKSKSPERPITRKCNENMTTTISKMALKSEVAPSPPGSLSKSIKTVNIPATPSHIKGTNKRPSVKRLKDNLTECKPPNVLVYAESASTRQSAMGALQDNLAENAMSFPCSYTIYNLTEEIVEKKCWPDTTFLLVVCGPIPAAFGEIFVDYFLRGGKVLSLCSDVLHFILPNYRTAEVREHELVQFSYDKWHKVKMMHHIFCYQPSPVRKNFSTESDEGSSANSQHPALVCLPRSIELMDLQGIAHQLDVKVLGTEETWNTPSLLLAQNRKNGGVAVFSQVHLEINPNEFEADENKYRTLKQNETIRHEIFSDLLRTHLGLNVKSENDFNGLTMKTVFQNAYFLGKHEAKFELLEKLKEKCDQNNLIHTPKLTLKFCGPNENLPKPANDMLPILIHSCPEDFSTVDYFENLKTSYIGRLVIYAPILSSSQHVVKDLDLTDGIVVIARQQTAGMGRDKNQWLSPLGCVMFSLQIRLPLNTPLGRRLPLVQHIVAAAMVNALKCHELYKNLDIRLKWPNDVYAYGINKIGGLCLHTFLTHEAVVNAGCGLNLDNDIPTTCINDMIRDYNRANQQKLPTLKYEELLALIFNEIERILELVKSGDFETFYKLYYSLWLHSDQAVSICDEKGSKKEARVMGIDDSGYLKVKLTNGVLETVYPDGNSFDMLKGLIMRKVF
ncbi:biotin--protein ligase isoform X2 [Glossina fuscipes]|uniref:Biotin--protein ligase isoform X2 n=1 Tax=Glossina fuscipes TaxID=7396 RepID=A0A9C5Z9U0_9MUSC|nr:biotin--protein ligase isoform X2 [Glossina fuscipes]